MKIRVIIEPDVPAEVRPQDLPGYHERMREAQERRLLREIGAPRRMPDRPARWITGSPYRNR